MNKLTTLTLLVLTVWNFGCSSQNPPTENTPVKKNTLPKTFPAVIDVPIQSPAELDFMSKDIILEKRKAVIQQSKESIDLTYHPREDIFNQIQDGKPWWGLVGQYAHGPSPQCLDGIAEESRFILNPYILVGVSEPNAWKSSTTPDPDSNFYPTPQEMQIEPNGTIQIRYLVEPYFDYLVRNNIPQAKNRELMLVAYNARDFGYNYLWINMDQSQNIDWFGKPSEPFELTQKLQLDSACGYPGGCNNMGPYQLDMIIRAGKTPARIVIYLWENKPESIAVDPDRIVVLLLEVGNGN